MQTKKLIEIIFNFSYILDKKKMFPYQAQFSKRVIKAVLDNDSDTITSLMSRQSGKSFTVSKTLAGLAIILPILANMPMLDGDERLVKFKNGMKIGIFAPITDQAKIIFNNIKDIYCSSAALDIFDDPEFNIKMGTFNGQQINVNFKNLDITSSISCRSASDKSNVEGASLHILVIDEAQDVGNFKYNKSIVPTTAFYNGTKILIGTPSIKKNFFYDTISENSKLFESTNKKNHYEYDANTVIKYNPNYEKHLNSQRARLGEESIEFQMSYMLQWFFSYGMFVTDDFTEEPLACRTLDRVSSYYNEECIVGIDIGKSQDSTVVTVGVSDYSTPVVLEQSQTSFLPDFIVHDVKVIDWLEIVGDDHEKQYHKIMDYLSRFKLRVVVIDSTGCGSPVADRLKANLECDVIPFTFSTQSKSELMKNFDTYIKMHAFHYPASVASRETIEYKKFVEQMMDLEKDYRGNHMVVSHPNERSKHDDYPYSCALMVWGLKYTGKETVQVYLDSPFSPDKNNRNITTIFNSMVDRRRERIVW